MPELRTCLLQCVNTFKYSYPVLQSVKNLQGIGGIMLWDVSWDQNNVINGQRYSEYAFKELGDVTVPPTQAPPPPVTTQAPPPPVTTEATLPQVTTQVPHPPTTPGKQNIASQEDKCSQATFSQCHCTLSSVGQSSAPCYSSFFFSFLFQLTNLLP